MSSTYKRFNEMYYDSQPTNDRKNLLLQSNFVNYGSEPKAIRNLPKPVT